MTKIESYPPPLTGSEVAPLRDDDEMVLADLVSRVLDRGVVLAGEVTLSVAGIDLVHLGLRLHLTSTESYLRRASANAAQSREPGDPAGEGPTGDSLP